MIKKYKDTYPFLTRVQPVLLVLLPFVIVGILFSFEFDKYIHILTSIGVYAMLSFLAAELGRDAGLKKQDGLWAVWGGAYSTQLLRWNDKTLPEQTKSDYYVKLQNQYPLDHVFDRNVNNDDDILFWTGKIRAKTRDKKKYPLIYAENVSYGFRRNLWGMKTAAITLILIVAVMFIVTYYNNLFVLKSFTFWAVETSMAILLLFWVVIVNRAWVSIPARAYAERLLEAI